MADACHFPPIECPYHAVERVGHRRAKTELFDCRTKAALPHQHSVEVWLDTAEVLPLLLSWCPLLSAVLEW